MRFVITFISLLSLLVTVSTVLAETSKIYQIKLRWQPVPGVRRYKVQISPQKKFQILIGEGEIEKPEWVWQYHSDTKSYRMKVFYRVASVNEQGEVGDFSRAQVIFLPELEEDHEKVEESHEEMLPRPQVTPSPTRVPQPIQTNFEAKKTVLNSLLRWSAFLQVGLGNLNQKSDTLELKEVSISPAIHEKFGFSLDSIRSFKMESSAGDIFENISLDDFKERVWSVQFQLQSQTFHKITDPRPFDQPDVSVYSMRFDFLKWVNGNSSVQFAYGVTLDRSFRWIKSGTESVDGQGALSLGPALSIVKFNPYLNGLQMTELGFFLGLPASGKMTGGQMGVMSSVWSEWNVVRFAKSNVGARIEGDFSYELWASPTSTTVMEESGWISLIFHLNP